MPEPYGWDHTLARRAAVKALQPGTPCPRCGWPMHPSLRQARAAGLPARLWRLDLGHWPGLACGGPQTTRLEHTYCNRKAGQLITSTHRSSASPPRGPAAGSQGTRRGRGSPPRARPVTPGVRRARW